MAPEINLLDGHGHVLPRADGLKARCGGPAICRVCALEQGRVHRPRPAYVVHEAGEVVNGRQACRRCGALLYDVAADQARGGGEEPEVVDTWGFPVGRRIVQSPSCLFLMTPDRELAGDEVTCR